MLTTKGAFYGLGLLCLYFLNSSVGLAQDSVTSYQYDARGRLSQIKNNASQQMNYAYDEAGNRVVVTNDVTKLPSASVPAITQFSAPNYVTSVGGYATISWTSVDTTHCALAIFGDYSQYPSLPVSGSQSVRIYEPTGIKVTCYNGSQSATMGKIIRIQSTSGGSFN